MHAKEKRQRFNEALAECAETASALEMIGSYTLASAEQCDHLLELAERIAAMLCALISRQQEMINSRSS